MPSATLRGVDFVAVDIEFSGSERLPLQTAISALGGVVSQLASGGAHDRGIRIGEAIALDSGDVDLAVGQLVVRHGKFGKTRELALHPRPSRRCAATRGFATRWPR